MSETTLVRNRKTPKNAATPSYPRNSVLLPSVAIMIDGVLAKRYQHGIDTLCLEGLDGFRGVMDETKLTSTLPCIDSHDPASLPEEMLRIRRLLSSQPEYWTSMPAYEDVDFDAIRSAIYEGDFVAHFLACRFPIDPACTGVVTDHRYLTRAWLDTYFAPRLIADSVNADLESAEIIPWLKMVHADYFLTSDLSQALDARAAGIEAYVLSRSWNEGVRLPFRVATVHDFLQKTVYKSRI